MWRGVHQLLALKQKLLFARNDSCSGEELRLELVDRHVGIVGHLVLVSIEHHHLEHLAGACGRRSCGCVLRQLKGLVEGGRRVHRGVQLSQAFHLLRRELAPGEACSRPLALAEVVNKALIASMTTGRGKDEIESNTSRLELCVWVVP